jgi:EpsI family protein
MSSTQTGVRFREVPAFVFAFAAVGFAFCYAHVCYELVRTWAADPLYSYGFAVPLISGYIVASRWGQFRAAIGEPDYALGSIAVVSAALMLVTGELGPALRLQQLSAVVMVTGVALLLFGRVAFRQIWFAAAYLLLMVPVWTDLISRLQVPSQLVSGRIAVGFFHLIAMPAVQEGTLIYLPRITLEILRECSGVNQLVAIFALTLPAAYLWLTGNLRRFLFVAVSLVIAYLSNGARIALIGVLAQKGFDTTSPRVHLAEGLLVATLGYGLIAVVFSALAAPRWLTPVRQREIGDRLESKKDPPARRLSFDVALLAVAIISASVGWVIPHTSVALRTALESLPRELGAWTREGAWEPAEGGSIAADDEVRYTYRRASGERVRLYVGYLRYQHAGKGLANALPQLPRGIQSTLAVDVDTIKHLNAVEQQSARGTSGVLFWYDIDGVSAADRFEAKRRVLWNGVTHGRTNGAVILVRWDAPPGVDPQISRERALDFIRSLSVVLPNYLPSRA